jgi:hypothetical protein
MSLSGQTETHALQQSTSTANADNCEFSRIVGVVATAKTGATNAPTSPSNDAIEVVGPIE